MEVATIGISAPRVLLIDADGAVREAFERCIACSEKPCEYELASSLAEADVLLSSRRFDVAVLECSETDLPAIELLDRQRNMAVIVTIKPGEEEFAARALKAGACDYLVKDTRHEYVKLLPAAIECASERRLCRSQSRMLSLAMRSVEDSVVITDMTGTITFVNSAFCRTYGYSESEILGKPDSVLTRHEPDRVHSGRRDTSSSLRRVTSHIARDGHSFPVSVVKSVVHDERGAEEAVVSVARNLSERLHVEQQRLMAIFTELDPAPVLRFDRGGRVLMHNRAAGETWGEQLEVDTTVSTLLPGMRRLDLAACIDDGSLFTHPERIGERFFEFVVRGVPELGVGHIYGMDATERRRTETLLELESAITTILASANDIHEAVQGILQLVCDKLDWDYADLFTFDKSAGVLRCAETWHQPSFVNDEFESRTREITFAPGVGLPGRVFASNSPAWIPDVTEDANFPRSASARRAGLHTAMAFLIRVGDRPSGIFSFFTRDVRESDPELLAKLDVLGSFIGQFVERKEAEEALKESHGLMQAVAAWTSDAVAIRDRDGRYILINASGARAIGKPAEDIVGRHATELLEPAQARKATERERTIVESRETLTFEEALEIEGVQRHFLSTEGPHLDAEGTVIGIIRVARDITEIKKLHEDAVAHARLAAIGQTMADIAHSMKNIFTGLRGAVSLLDKALKSDDPELTVNCHEILHRTSNRLYLLLMTMLDYSKKRKAARNPVRVEDMFEDFSRDLFMDARQRGVTIEWKIAKGAEVISLDGQRFFLSLMNLGTNAMDAMPDGGVLKLASYLSLATQTPSWTNKSTPEADNPHYQIHVIEVTDTGKGIPAKALSKIFLPYFSTKESHGTGLGLASVKQFVDDHGGQVGVESAEDRGTTFRLMFPCRPEGADDNEG
jgi:PAS domain S-box-containing protein